MDPKPTPPNISTPPAVTHGRGCAPGCLASAGGLGLLGALLVAVVIGVEFVLTAMGGLLIIADPLEKAQVAVVLAGGRGDRVEEAVRLVQEKYIEQIVLTHPDQGGEEDMSSVAAMRQQAAELGISDGAILVTGRHGNSTYGEAGELRRFLEERGIQQALVVTDPFHTFRTRLIFRQVFAGSSVDINVRPVRGHWYRSTTWWATRAGRDATLSEYAKLFAHLAGMRSE